MGTVNSNTVNSNTVNLNTVNSNFTVNSKFYSKYDRLNCIGNQTIYLQAKMFEKAAELCRIESINYPHQKCGEIYRY